MKLVAGKLTKINDDSLVYNSHYKINTKQHRLRAFDKQPRSVDGAGDAVEAGVVQGLIQTPEKIQNRMHYDTSYVRHNCMCTPLCEYTP